MKKFFLILAIFTSVISCNKDEKVKVLTPKEQAKVDDDQTLEYMNSNKVIDFNVGGMINNVDWKIVPLDDDDTEDTETLFDLMGDNVINTSYKGVDYKMYYYVKDIGKGSKVADTDNIFVDYNLFRLSGSEMKERIDHSLFTTKFDIQKLIEGWRIGLINFNSGQKPSVFPGDSNFPYRKLVDTPGRGIFIVPSGLAYGSGSGVLRFDVVIYDNIPVEE